MRAVLSHKSATLTSTLTCVINYRSLSVVARSEEGSQKRGERPRDHRRQRPTVLRLRSVLRVQTQSLLLLVELLSH